LNIIGDMVVIIVCALIFSLIIESPLLNLEKKYLMPQAKPKDSQ